MSKVASITISAKSPSRSSFDKSSTSVMSTSASSRTDQANANDNAATTSDSDDDRFTRRRRSSSAGTNSSPERKKSVDKQQKVYDEERGLINSKRSGRMSTRQRTLEKELNTEDPTLVASHDEALALSSDDGLEDQFISRKTKAPDSNYYMVKETTQDEHGGSSVYEKRNIEPPKKKSEPTGNRVRSATGKLMDNYVKDQSFDNLSEDEKATIEKSQLPVSMLKSAYINQANGAQSADRSKIELELEQIRNNFRSQGMMQDSDDDDDDVKNRNPPQEREVLYRKPLKNIKSRFLAAASGQKVLSSSDSDGETADGKEKEEILSSPTRVVDMKQKWQKQQNWHDDQKVNAKEVIDITQVNSARSAFRQMETKKDTASTVNRPKVQRINDPKQVMQQRRHKTYGDDNEQVDGIVKHSGLEELSTVSIDTNQIKAARRGYEDLEGLKLQKKSLLKKPSMKLIKQEEVKKTMDDHRRKVSNETEFEDIQSDSHVTNGASDEL